MQPKNERNKKTTINNFIDTKHYTNYTEYTIN